MLHNAFLAKQFTICSLLTFLSSAQPAPIQVHRATNIHDPDGHSVTWEQTWDGHWTPLSSTHTENLASSSSRNSSSKASYTPTPSAPVIDSFSTTPTSTPSSSTANRITGLAAGAIALGSIIAGLGLVWLALIIAKFYRNRIKQQLSSSPGEVDESCPRTEFPVALQPHAYSDGKILAETDAHMPPPRYQFVNPTGLPNPPERAELPGDHGLRAEIEAPMAHELYGDVPAVELPAVRHSHLPPPVLQTGDVAYAHQLGVPTAHGRRQQLWAGRIGSRW